MFPSIPSSKPVAARAVSAATLGAVLGLLAAAPAGAQGGTAAERMACMTDAMTYCGADIPNEGRIEACLRRNQPRISAACQQVLGPPPALDEVTATGSLRPETAPAGTSAGTRRTAGRVRTP